MDKDLKRMIILENYQNPKNKQIPTEEGYVKINSNNVSCIDNLDIYVKACVICISSTSIITNLLIGKTIEEAKDILENYHNMIEEKPYNKDILKEALVYDDIYKQPSRKTCATLATRGLSKLLNETTEK